MSLAFDQLFGKISKGTDAVVRQEAAYKSSSASRGPISDKVLDQVRRETPDRSKSPQVVEDTIVDEIAGPTADSVLDYMKHLGA